MAFDHIHREDGILGEPAAAPLGADQALGIGAHELLKIRHSTRWIETHDPGDVPLMASGGAGLQHRPGMSGFAYAHDENGVAGIAGMTLPNNDFRRLRWYVDCVGATQGHLDRPGPTSPFLPR